MKRNLPENQNRIFISDEVGVAFKQIYQFDNAGRLPENGEIARKLHGIQHVTNAAIYARVFINLFRLFGDQEALALTEDDIAHIQVALLYHDSVRISDRYNHLSDERESGTTLYKYLIKLRVEPSKAKKLAEAMANKDYLAFGSTQDCYYELNADTVTWEVAQHPPLERNVYQRIIHDADCLHIQRVEARYNKEYLDFF